MEWERPQPARFGGSFLNRSKLGAMCRDVAEPTRRARQGPLDRLASRPYTPTGIEAIEALAQLALFGFLLAQGNHDAIDPLAQDFLVAGRGQIEISIGDHGERLSLLGSAAGEDQAEKQSPSVA